MTVDGVTKDDVRVPEGYRPLPQQVPPLEREQGDEV